MTSTSPVLARGPGDCCVTGFKHEGTAVGKVITIAGIKTYISEPKKASTGPKKIILFLSDVFGPFFPNNEFIQDFFAESDYLVLGPDYFFGDYMHNHTEPDFLEHRDDWFAAKLKVARAAFPAWLSAVKEQYGSDALYCPAGYCFGAPFALDLAAQEDTVAAAIAHPSFLNEAHFTNIIKPVFLSLAETDMMFPLASRRRAEDLLLNGKKSYHIQRFSGVEHGWAVRGNPEVENERWAKEESARGIVNWFSRFITLKLAAA